MVSGNVGVYEGRGGGGGGTGGAGGFFHTLNFPGSGTLTASSNGVQIHDPVPVLEQKTEALKKQVDLLVKQAVDKEDIEYFRRNLFKALKIPPDYLSESPVPDLKVGPNDILVVHLDVSCVPNDQVETFRQKTITSLTPAFEERGLKGRILWLTTRNEGSTRFSVIGIERFKELNKRWTPPNPDEDINIPVRETFTKEDVEEARRTLRAKRKYPPPIMG